MFTLLFFIITSGGIIYTLFKTSSWDTDKELKKLESHPDKLKQQLKELECVYDLSAKRSYPITVWDGSVVMVNEEDFWLNEKGCYNHGYVDFEPKKECTELQRGFFEIYAKQYEKALITEDQISAKYKSRIIVHHHNGRKHEKQTS